MSDWARPKLRPDQLSNPSTYVVDADVVKVRDLVDTHAGEFEQWRMRDEMTPTACGILAVLSVFRGLRGGVEGCGVQWSIWTWMAVLGRSERMVQYAFDELAALGYVSRYRRYVKVDPWTDAQGREHHHADIHAATYLTRLGAVRIERRGETRDLKVRDGSGHTLVLRAAGVVGDLLKTLKPILRTVGRRVTDAANRCTPSLTATAKGVQAAPSQVFLSERSLDHDRSSESEPVENGTGTAERHSRIPLVGVAGPDGMGAEIERCWRYRLTTAGQWRPEHWENADERERAFLTEQFKPIRSAIARRIADEANAAAAAEREQAAAAELAKLAAFDALTERDWGWC